MKCFGTHLLLFLLGLGIGLILQFIAGFLSAVWKDRKLIVDKFKGVEK